MATVIIYSTPTCGFCHMAKDYFRENNVAFEDKDVSIDMSARQEMLDKSQQMGVPVIDVDGSIIVGFNRPKLQQLLGLPS